MSTKINITFFVTSLQSGGIENYLLRFLKKYHHEFNQVLVWCKSGVAGQLEQDYRRLANVTIVKRKIGFLNPFPYYRTGRLLRKLKIDAICDFTGNFGGPVMLIGAFFAIKKRIVFYRGSSDKFHKTVLKALYNDLCKRMVASYATDILSNSAAAFDYFYRDHWRSNVKFEVIYNGIDAAAFSSGSDLRHLLDIPTNAFVVGHTGRFHPAKNHQTILKVAEKLIEKFDDMYFIMCGNNVQTELEPLIRSKNLQQRIKVFNNRSDIPSFLKTMNCYYFPSLTEGQPNALIEAMVTGLPIVASNIAPIKEMVPKAMASDLVSPMDVKHACEKIQAIYFEGPRFDCRAWAIANFDADRLFTQFFNRL